MPEAAELALDRLLRDRFDGLQLLGDSAHETHDLDFVLRIGPEAVNPLVKAFSTDFYIDEEAVRAAFSPPYQFNAIDTRSALKVDFWLSRPTQFDQEMLLRRISKSIEHFNK